MILKVLGVLILIFVAFLVAVSFRAPDFRYERSGLIQAPPEKIFPYLVDLSKNGEWSPYEKMDPAIKKTLSGQMGQVGSKMEFASENAGNGSLEVLKVNAPEVVELSLNMTKPFVADNLVEYRLTPEPTGTRFTWTMSGHNGYLRKLIGTLVSVDKMVGSQFEEGIANLKALVEKQP